ncbi:MAG TPA: response regulator [Nitrospiraceae bacterium]|nr:response regulator [Nitrospiraceae bacterium]
MSRILVIDDEEFIRQALRSILERAGHTVLDAPNGREGMRLWQDVPVDVVVTDIYMPEKDGMQVLSEMKQLATKPKIIAMSGGGHKGLLDWREAALALGAHRVLLKPFDEQTVLVTLQEVLTGHTGAHNDVPRTSSTEQRKFPRVPVSFPVYFSDSMIAQSGTVVDISREGCRIRCPDAAPDLRYFQVEIHLAEPQGTLTVDLAVRRWSRDKELGIEFIRMEPEQQARLLSVIRRGERGSAPR